MVKRKFISTRLLHEGMQIDQAIKDGTGRTLIEKGVLLDDFQIEYLQTKGVSGIYISEGKPDENELDIFIPQFTQNVIEKNRVADKAKVKLTEEVKKRVGEGIQYLFNNTSSESFAEDSEKVSGELMKSIMEEDAVAIDIGMLKVSDEYTFKHSVDVAAMSLIIGKNLGLDKEELRQLGIAGLLHDVGKSMVPNEVLNKPGKLSDNEFALMKQHTLFGFKILKERGGFSDAVMRGVLQHHEKISGRGYPQGLPANNIHKFAKIISVADVYDALVTERPYKKGFSKQTALEMIMAMTADLDMTAMKTFMNTVILYPVDSYVTLSNGELAKVIENIPGYPLRPKVVSIKTGKIYDLSNDIECASMIIPED